MEREGERESFSSYKWPLALSHTPFSYLHYLFFIHQIRRADTVFFLLLRACLFAACHIFSCSVSSSMVMIIWKTSEIFATFTKERAVSAEKWSFDRHCNKKENVHLNGLCQVDVSATLWYQKCIKDSPSHDTKQRSNDDISIVGKPRSYLHSCILILIVYVFLWINDENHVCVYYKCMIFSIEITWQTTTAFNRWNWRNILSVLPRVLTVVKH